MQSAEEDGLLHEGLWRGIEKRKEEFFLDDLSPV